MTYPVVLFKRAGTSWPKTLHLNASNTLFYLDQSLPPSPPAVPSLPPPPLISWARHWQGTLLVVMVGLLVAGSAAWVAYQLYSKWYNNVPGMGPYRFIPLAVLEHKTLGS